MATDSLTLNIADRCRQLVALAKRAGYAVRFEPLGGGTDWCEIAGRIHLFIDLQESTTEQVAAIDAILQGGPVGRRPINPAGSAD